MRPDGMKKKNLTNNSADDSDAVVFPEGQKIAFKSERDGNEEIYVMNMDGTDQKRVTNNPGFDSDPTWRPEGLIYFSSNRDGDDDIYVTDLQGRK